MIALTLLLLLGLYLGLFVLVGIKAKSWTPRVLLWLVLLSPVIALTWDMPVGYYRYKTLCAAEGGLRVYEPYPPQAKVLRLDAAHFFESDARGLLGDYPTLEAIETSDERFSGARPRAYARYARNPLSPIPTKGPRDRFNPVVTLLDKVEDQPGGQVTLAAGPSQADYILTQEHEDRPIRLSITRRWLRKTDGTPVASTTSIVYAWTNEQNTLLGRTSAEYCGDIPGKADLNGKALFGLIAKPITE